MGTPTMKVRYAYVHEDVDRHGNVRVYFWRKGQRKVRMREAPGSPEFAETYKRLLGRSEAGELATPDAGRSDTLRWLCTQYFASAEFRRLDPQTQRTRQGILEHILAEPVAPGARETFSGFPVGRLSSKAVSVLRDRKAELPGSADNRVKAMRRLFAWAKEQELVTSNPALDVRYVSGTTTGHHTWSIDEVEQFEAHHPIGTKARLALSLLLYTGVRRSDVVLLGRQHVRDGWLKFTQQKGRNRRPITVEIPVLDVLKDVLDRSPTGDLTFLVTEYGRPFAVAGFGNKFRQWCDEAELSQCSAHGLRKAGATIAAENGATSHQLMSIFGWLTLQQAERYTRGAERKRLAGEAMNLLVRPKK